MPANGTSWLRADLQQCVELQRNPRCTHRLLIGNKIALWMQSCPEPTGTPGSRKRKLWQCSPSPAQRSPCTQQVCRGHWATKPEPAHPSQDQRRLGYSVSEWATSKQTVQTVPSATRTKGRATIRKKQVGRVTELGAGGWAATGHHSPWETPPVLGLGVELSWGQRSFHTTPATQDGHFL